MKLYWFLRDLFHKNDSFVEYVSWEQKISYIEKNDSVKDGQENLKSNIPWDNKTDRFSFKMSPEKKQNIAERIIEESNVDKMYWIQLIISCMLATLWLLSNSIPVIIWSMLVSPILTPIQSFAFAIVCGKKHMYLQSMKVLLLSLLIAVTSSFLICYFVPFASLTEQVLLRGTPTVVDLVVALLSWIIAFLFLSSEKLWESIVWIAIAVSLMPPLAAVWIWLHFMDFSVAQWSFLLFVTNLVWILVMWICVFFLFWFKPTNKTWKKRTEITLVMVVALICLIIIPLWKSMSQIAWDQKITNIINQVSDDYLKTLNDWIVVNSMSFRNLQNNTVRVTVKLDVPSNFKITNSHKEEMTKKLSEYLEKSVELDLEIVEISKVYIDEIDSREKVFIKKATDLLVENWSILIDSKILSEWDVKFFFLDVYTDSNTDKNDIYRLLVDELDSSFWSWAKLVLQWQENTEILRVEKSQAEIDLEKQFIVLLPGAELLSLKLEYSEKMHDETYVEFANLFLEFNSPYSSYKTKAILSEWKPIIQEYLWMDVNINAKFESFSLMEL